MKLLLTYLFFIAIGGLFFACGGSSDPGVTKLPAKVENSPTPTPSPSPSPFDFPISVTSFQCGQNLCNTNTRYCFQTKYPDPNVLGNFLISSSSCNPNTDSCSNCDCILNLAKKGSISCPIGIGCAESNSEFTVSCLQSTQ